MSQSVRHPHSDVVIDESIRMPEVDFPSTSANMVISEVVGNYEHFLEDEEKVRQQYPWATRFVMGYPLPSWQRALTWSDEQKARFITSIWSGVDIGSYLINDQYDTLLVEGAKTFQYRKFSNIILDGQQRLQAIQDYLNDLFAVPDAQGTPRRWSDLPRRERRRFESRHFARCSVKCWDEATLRHIYNLRAFGGTAHEAHEMA